MGECRENQPPAKLFFALMARADEAFAAAEERLEAEFGPIDARDETYDFDPLTGYYAAEFGTGLRKRIVAARDLAAPERLVAIKRRTNEIEIELARRFAPRAPEADGGTAEPPAGAAPRRVANIDPGYLNHSKVVLATTKDQAHRLYVGQGIFEEVTLGFHKAAGGFQPNPWTYPDYRMAARIDFFGRLRQMYCRQLEAPR